MARILTVDDEPINQALLGDLLCDQGYQVDQAIDGREAWEKIQTGKFDLVLLDRVMPGMDGMSLLRQIKADTRFQHTPVIMQTSMDDQGEVCEGLEAGAHYYLTKPYDPGSVKAIVDTVLFDLNERKLLRQTQNQFQSSLNLLDDACFSFRTHSDARSLAVALSSMCADSKQVAIGLAELMLNAVEHGNLGLTYEDKSRLLGSDGWSEEIDHRLEKAPWSSRSASIRVQQDCHDIEFVIEDQGEGFDWSRYLEFDPERAFDSHGRGIAMARSGVFPTLEYRGRGNIVAATTNRNGAIQ